MRVEYDIHHVRVHSRTRRIGNDDIRTAMGGDKVIRKNVFHVAGIEVSVRYSVNLRIYFRVLYRLRNILYADNPTRLTRNKVCDSACTRV